MQHTQENPYISEIDKLSLQLGLMPTQKNGENNAYGLFDEGSYQKKLSVILRNGKIEIQDFDPIYLARIKFVNPGLYQQTVDALGDAVPENFKDIYFWESVESMQRARDSDLERLNGLLSLPKLSPSESSASEAQMRGVYQQQGFSTQASDQKPLLATAGVGPCVAVIMHCPETKKAALIHLDNATSTYEIINRSNDIRTNDSMPINIHILGGKKWGSESTVINIATTLSHVKNANLISADLLNSERPDRIAIDSNAGELYSNFDPAKVSFDDNKWSVLASASRHNGSESFIGSKRTPPTKREGGWTPPRTEIE